MDSEFQTCRDCHALIDDAYQHAKWHERQASYIRQLLAKLESTELELRRLRDAS